MIQYNYHIQIDIRNAVLIKPKVDRSQKTFIVLTFKKNRMTMAHKKASLEYSDAFLRAMVISYLFIPIQVNVPQTCTPNM